MRYDRLELADWKWFRIARLCNLLVAIGGQLDKLLFTEVTREGTIQVFHTGLGDRGVINLDGQSFFESTPQDFGIQSIRTVPVGLS